MYGGPLPTAPHVPYPLTGVGPSNRTCGFPASGSPTDFIARPFSTTTRRTGRVRCLMGASHFISRPAVSHGFCCPSFLRDVSRRLKWAAETDSVAGVVGLELGNACASHKFETPLRYLNNLL